jgi:toxoflavin synthase
MSREIFSQRGGPVDIVVAPFVINYARTVPILKHFFGLVYESLWVGGKAVFVVDLPNGKNLKRFGAMKTFLDPSADEARIQIELFNDTKKICTLSGIYYTQQTIERLLMEIGFEDVYWHNPIISPEGIRVLGAEFWKGYIDDPELGYLTVRK